MKTLQRVGRLLIVLAALIALGVLVRLVGDGLDAIWTPLDSLAGLAALLVFAAWLVKPGTKQ